ncbi:uncharacterized protein PAN0_002c1389 [Moesziomyces antarcticus]|uniref:uncharacterized protein n=1 Tax=Pseudozyma antarctica TaxID=84753 RepID=UPI00071952CB|nr:uncharacterized protein PAN0_002c1389 [Moesziomyces antarcticus]GAK63186.1 hypothetical protein PAN0_002c1389 [Moesziomyces antarcticus]
MAPAQVRLGHDRNEGSIACLAKASMLPDPDKAHLHQDVRVLQSARNWLDPPSGSPECGPSGLKIVGPPRVAPHPTQRTLTCRDTPGLGTNREAELSRRWSENRHSLSQAVWEYNIATVQLRGITPAFDANEPFQKPFDQCDVRLGLSAAQIENLLLAEALYLAGQIQ